MHKGLPLVGNSIFYSRQTREPGPYSSLSATSTILLGERDRDPKPGSATHLHVTLGRNLPISEPQLPQLSN